MVRRAPGSGSNGTWFSPHGPALCRRICLVFAGLRPGQGPTVFLFPPEKPASGRFIRQIVYPARILFTPRSYQGLEMSCRGGDEESVLKARPFVFTQGDSLTGWR